MDAFFGLKNIQNDLETEITVFGADLSCEKCGESISEAENDFIYSESERDEPSGSERIEEISRNLQRLTCTADASDYAAVAVCGALAGRISPIINKVIKLGYGKDKAKKTFKSCDEEIFENDTHLSEKTENTEKDEAFSDEFLKNLAKDCGDEIPEKGNRLSDRKNLLGLVLSIAEQFSESEEFTPDLPNGFNELMVEINSKGSFVGRSRKSKIFSGIINWFFKMARESGDAYNGSGVKCGFYRMLFPLIAFAGKMSAIPCVGERDFGDRLCGVFKEYVCSGKGERLRVQLEGIFPADEGKSFLKGKMSSVILNELLVRAVFFVKGFVRQMKENYSLSLLDFSALIVQKDRTLERMMSVSLGVFTAIDVSRNALRAVTRGGAIYLPKFFLDMVLKVNIVGIGRFVLTVKNDAEMLSEAEGLRNERIRLCGEQMTFNCTQVFYKQGKMWRSAENTVLTLAEVSLLAEKTAELYMKSINEMASDIAEIKERLQRQSEKERLFFDEVADIIKYE